ncbi:MAG TPA: SDR family NAD(P)-dependent oxidoreductase [Labilithrix sp.]
MTGASSGIGLELAKCFAQNGFDLVICAEDERINACAREIEQLGAKVKPVQADLATWDGVEQLWNEARAIGPIEACALNAGVGVGGEFVGETSLRDELRLIELNVVSVVHLAKLVAKDMVARKRGRILVTASIAGAMPTPLEAVYGASKAFDLSFAASLRHELKDTGVTVTALTPGPTDTEFFERAGLSDTKVAEEAKKNHPADVAKQGFEALMKGEDRVVGATTLKTKLEGAAARFMPESTKAAMHEKQSKPGSSSR